MFIILKTYTESLSYISTSFSPLGPGPCLLVAYRVRVSLDNRNERKWTTKQSSIIRIRDKKWNGDALEKCFFLSLFGFGWPSKQFRKEQRCASTRWDVILMMYCWLSIDKFTFIIYPCTVYHWFFILSLLCLKFRERTSFFLFHILFRFLFVCWFVLWPFYTAHRSIRCGFSFIFQFKCVPMHLWALFIV